jgi:hypothetical protein
MKKEIIAKIRELDMKQLILNSRLEELNRFLEAAGSLKNCYVIISDGDRLSISIHNDITIYAKLFHGDVNYLIKLYKEQLIQQIKDIDKQILNL